MIIKSHVRGGFHTLATYLKNIGENEKSRLVELSDYDATNLDEAFHNMWAIACTVKSKKPLHHISINPFKDERLTDAQVFKIVAHCEEAYGYKPGEHQRVIVEHIKGGRQHFHVIWCRISLDTGRPVSPGQDWIRSKYVARTMERELGLKCPVPRRVKRQWASITNSRRASRYLGRYGELSSRPVPKSRPTHISWRNRRYTMLPKSIPTIPTIPTESSNLRGREGDAKSDISDSKQMPFHHQQMDSLQLLAWAWEHHRADILAQFGINIDFEP